MGLCPSSHYKTATNIPRSETTITSTLTLISILHILALRICQTCQDHT